MTTLALIKDGAIVATVTAGRSFDLPDGTRIGTKAVAGLRMTDGYSLAGIAQADAIPEGKQSSGMTAQMVGGAPKWVHTLEDIPPAPRRTEGTFREFMDLFTQTEQLAIAGAAMSDVAVKLWYDRAMGGTVRLDAAETAQGLAAIVLGGLITQARADAILAADYDAA